MKASARSRSFRVNTRSALLQAGSSRTTDLVTPGSRSFRKAGSQDGLALQIGGSTDNSESAHVCVVHFSDCSTRYLLGLGLATSGSLYKSSHCAERGKAFKIISSYSCSASERYVMAPPTPISAMVGVMTMVRITIFRSTVALSDRYPMAPE